MKKTIMKFLYQHTKRIVDTNNQKFKMYPKWLIWFILFLSYNVLVQGVADLAIKFSGYTPWIIGFPARWDFLFLTAVSVLMGYQVLIGMRRRELDVTRNSFALGLLVESGLIISDVVYLAKHMNNHEYLLAFRLPFIILTVMNFFILYSIARHLKLFQNEKGKFVLV